MGRVGCRMNFGEDSLVVGVALTHDTRAWVLFLVSHFLVVQTGTFLVDLFPYL